MIRVLTMAMVLWFVAAPALAGGSWLEPDRVSYQPGEHAVATATVYRGQLGWVEDGPFHAYLAESHQVPADRGIPLGELRIDPVSDGTISVTLEFVVPPVTPGEYAIVYCNDPCTNGVGDLIGGSLRVTAATLPFTGHPTRGAVVVAGMLVVVGLSVLSRARSAKPRSR